MGNRTSSVDPNQWLHMVRHFRQFPMLNPAATAPKDRHRHRWQHGPYIRLGSDWLFDENTEGGHMTITPIVSHVIEKLGVHSKLQALIAAERLGLIEL